MASSPLRPELLERLVAVAHERGDARAAQTLRAIVGGKPSFLTAPSSLDSVAPEEPNGPIKYTKLFNILTLDRMLAEAGGLPAGVVELAAPAGLARTTQLALRACAAAQQPCAEAQQPCAEAQQPCAEAQQQSPAGRHRSPAVDCAFVDASRSLYAPGVHQQGVDLDRMLVVQPPPEDIARVAVRLASSGLFSRVVVDRCGVPGASLACPTIRWRIAVRRLALAAEQHETTILLLSDLARARRDTLPVAMRIELTRTAADQLSLRIVKERHGRLPPPCTLPLGELQRGTAFASTALRPDHDTKMAG